MFNGGLIKRDHSTANFNNKNLAPSIPLYYHNNYSSQHHNPLPPLYRPSKGSIYNADLNNLGKRVLGYNNLNINSSFPKVPLTGYCLEDFNKYLQKGKQIQQQQYEKYIANAQYKKQIVNDMQTKIKLLGKSPLEEEYNKLLEADHHKEWKVSLKSEVNEMKNEIKSQIEEETKRGNELLNMKKKERKENSLNTINRSLIDLKRELSSQLVEFDKNAKYTFDDIKASLAQSNEKQLEYLINKIFPIQPQIHRSESSVQTTKRDQSNDYRRINEQEIQIDNAFNKELQNQQLNREGNMDNNQSNQMQNKNINNSDIINDINNFQIVPQLNKPPIDYDNMVYNLDYRERYLQRQHRTHKEIIKRLVSYSHFCEKQSPISRFRTYVYFMIASKRLLNIQYTIYSRFKFNSAHYFINNYEDMDIIIKKNMYRSISPIISELLTDEYLDINISYQKANSHSLFLILKELLDVIITGLTKDFSKGVSGSMLKYLSLFITNHSYIPSSFFTTFELVRFRTTPTGEFIGLEREQQIMILGFYLFFKILLKSILLELTFRQESIPNLSRKCKMNIKMIVSIIYRGLIDEFKKCPRQRNIYNIQLKEAFSNYREIGFVKKEFDIDYKMRRRKKNANDSIGNIEKNNYIDRYLYGVYKEGLNDEGKENLELPPLKKMGIEENTSAPKKKKLRRVMKSLSLPQIDSQQSLGPKANETLARGEMRRNEEEFVNWMKEEGKIYELNSEDKSVLNSNIEVNADGNINNNAVGKKKKRTGKGKGKGKGNTEGIILENNNKSNQGEDILKDKTNTKNIINADLQRHQQQADEKEIGQQSNLPVKSKTNKKRKGKTDVDVEDMPNCNLEDNFNPNNNINEEEEGLIDNEEGNKSRTVKAKTTTAKIRALRKNKAPRMPPTLEVSPPEHPKKPREIKRKTKIEKQKDPQNEEQQEDVEEEGQAEERKAEEGQVEEEEEDLKTNKTLKPKRTKKPIKIDQMEEDELPINQIIKLKKKRQLNASKSQMNINPNSKLQSKSKVNILEEIPINQREMILTEENKWLYKLPIFPPEFSQEEIKTMKYIFKELPQFGDDSDQNEFELIDRIVYQKDKLEIYELFRDEYGFDPISPLMIFLEDLLDLILTHFNQEDD